MNSNLDEKAAGTPWANENLIKVDDDLWYGLGIGLYNFDDMKNELARIALEEEPSKEYIENNIFVKQIEIINSNAK